MAQNMIRRLAPLGLAVSLTMALGCGDDDGGADGDSAGIDGGGGSGDGGGSTLDGGAPDGGEEVGCPLPEELGNLGALANIVAIQSPQDRGMPDGPQLRSLVGGLVDSQVVIELYDGVGAFADGAATTGTFAIEGDDAAANICGLCVSLFGASEPRGEQLFYFAVSGTVTLDSVNDTLSGRLDDVTFREVDPDSGDGTPLEGGCSTHLGGISFEGTIIPG